MGNPRISNKKVIRKKKKKRHPLRKIFCLLMLIIIVLSAYLAFMTFLNGGGKKGLVATILGVKLSNSEQPKQLNVLVAGVSTDIKTPFTDTIMFCQYNPTTQKASILSIPRDTFVGNNTNSAKASDKINSIYGRKGIGALQEKVSSLVDEKIDYYVVVKTEALIEMVDVIGGVWFDVPIDMVYDDPTQDLHINLKAGYQKLDGDKAEQLLRFRHSNPDSNGRTTTYPAEYGSDDYGRMRTQREFMKATLKQTMSIKNALRIRKIINCIFDNVETNMSEDEIKAYLPYVVEFELANIQMNQLPGSSTNDYNSIWFFINNKSKTKELMQSINQYLAN